MAEFKEILAGMKQVGGVWRLEIPESWMQGRTAFGGLLAAAALRAMRGGLGLQAPLLTVDVGFVAPVKGAVSIEVELLRQGRNVAHVVARVGAEDGATATRVYAVFGAPRESDIEVEAPLPRPTMAREAGTLFPYIAGMTPEFTQFFEYHLTEGAFPYSGASEGVLGGFFRHKTAHDGDEEAVLALVDAWPPAVLPMGDKPFFGSTVRWSCHFVGDVPEGFDGDWWYRAQTVAGRHGYATTKAVLYAGDRLVCWSEQLVAVFDK